jgi:hypothetical protein
LHVAVLRVLLEALPTSVEEKCRRCTLVALS